LIITTTSATPTGTYPLIIGATDGSQSYFPNATLVVNAPATASTTTALSITPGGGTLPAGGPFTLTATVSAGSGSNTPAGNVVFTVSSTIQTVALNSSGIATYAGTAPATAGTLTLSAAYQGSAAFLASTSNALAETITVSPTSTATILSIAPAGVTLPAGGPYTLTATVSPKAGSARPSGDVVFTVGSATQTVALNSSGIATYTGTIPTTAGPLTLSAAYQGSAVFLASTSNILTETITVSPTSTATILSIAPASGTLPVDGSYTLTASVSPKAGSATPSPKF
jgi:hypothetical protein